MDDKLRTQVKTLLEKNRRTAGKYQYTVPSPESYPYQWLWDSCFHAIILTHFSIADAKEELRSLVSRQFESGLIPHIIYWERKKGVLNFDWGVSDTSAITQPPLIAYAALRIYEAGGGVGFLREMYPTLVRYYRYLLTRDSRSHHLVGLINPDESGEDNSPRFDAALGLPPKHEIGKNNKKRFALFVKNKTCNFDAPRCVRNFFWVKDVPYSVYMVENLSCMGSIAEKLGKTGDAAYFYEQTELMKAAMHRFMYEDGIYWSICGPDHEKIKVRTWALFAPLSAGIATEKDAHALVEKHLLNTDEFRARYLLPTTAMDEPAYRPTEPTDEPTWLHPNWRGPVWMAPNWFVCRGLRRYGFNELADEIREGSTRLIERSGFREYYHPETGAGMGAHSFTWGGLVLDM